VLGRFVVERPDHEFAWYPEFLDGLLQTVVLVIGSTDPHQLRCKVLLTLPRQYNHWGKNSCRSAPRTHQGEGAPVSPGTLVDVRQVRRKR
jgi:hypothetical protein